MNKEEIEMMKNAVNAAVLLRTKEEILSELAYTSKFVNAKANKTVAEQINISLAGIIQNVEELYSDIEVGLAMGEINSEVGEALRELDQYYVSSK